MKCFKALISFVIIFLVVGCASLRRSVKNKKNTFTQEIIKFDTSLIKNKERSAFDILIATYADSINNMNEGKLPFFLTDVQFDYHHTGIFSPFHSPLPLRKLIFDKVDNCNSLILIIDADAEALKRKPQIENDISVEFIEYSYFDLAKKRIDELKCL
ncbi:hypothetical protein [Pseudobacter ginsenosidimutans]|uniref:Lipoprotein n=1 Tax=Pseudobacter ginsenosidimutans TaxID=661488 RepID=A0A4Q7MWB6_9BACT|nr:hypothetical protein [Pseudobacter ginsenosidimutans]QEC41843.1 hypothetical protein FSB84_09125 [Pseudobacter ginsenosidimutans]RZS71340.1 hypothetical protein EV199_3243 [Pseudobacter ginsenosidimutans]